LKIDVACALFPGYSWLVPGNRSDVKLYQTLGVVSVMFDSDVRSLDVDIFTVVEW